MAGRQILSRTRRLVLSAGMGMAAGVLQLRPVAAAELPADLLAAMQVFAQGAAVREGRVVLEIAELVDNGNAVPVRVAIDGGAPATAPVVAMALFNERNPQREVVVAQFGVLSGRPEFSTRIRLATSQKLVAMARLQDGSCWFRSVDVIVTLAACIEGES